MTRRTALLSGAVVVVAGVGVVAGLTAAEQGWHATARLGLIAFLLGFAACAVVRGAAHAVVRRRVGRGAPLRVSQRLLDPDVNPVVRPYLLQVLAEDPGRGPARVVRHTDGTVSVLNMRFGSDWHLTGDGVATTLPGGEVRVFIPAEIEDDEGYRP